MNTRNVMNSKGLLAAAVSAALLASAPAVAEDSGRSFEIYGFAQADYIQDFGGRLDPDWDDAFRPSKICFDGACGDDGQASISVKQSRFGVKGTMPTGEGSTPLNFKFEFDLFGTGVDAGQTTIRLRHAYGEWGQFLAGQTNSLFMDGDVFPNTIDYWGPSGMVFYRNVQIRWTPFKTDNSHFAIAIERPGNDIDSGNLRLIEGLEDVDVKNDEELPGPDGAVPLTAATGATCSSAASCARWATRLRADPADCWTEGSETGWGINVGSVINVLEKDAIRLQVVYGEGIASYMNDGGMDLAPSATDIAAQRPGSAGRGGPAHWACSRTTTTGGATSGRARSATASRKWTTPTSRTRARSRRSTTPRATCCITRPRT